MSVTITIGQIIKKLRKERNLTQEELAEQLNVTSKAVSKWESETGMPDISQVVPLARVFGVSTDVLFGIFGQNDNEEVQKIINEIEKECDFDDIFDEKGFPDDEKEIAAGKKECELLREALKQYPNNMNLLNHSINRFSAHVICKTAGNDVDGLYEECVRIANVIINHGKDMNIVMNAHRCLVEIYSRFGEYDKAYGHANLFPAGFDMNRETLLAKIKWESKDIDGELKQRCENIESILYTINHEIVMLGKIYGRKGQYEDSIFVLKSIFDIITAVYGDEEFTPPLHLLSATYIHIANQYFMLGDNDNGYLWLEKLIDHHINNEKYFNKRTKLKTPLLRECVFMYPLLKEYNAKGTIYNAFDNFQLNEIKETERFKALLDRVKNLD